MPDVRVSQEARLDLETIRNIGIERFGTDAAERHLRSIRHAFELLAQHPLIGQARPEFRPAIRSLARRPHSILYTLQHDVVVVVRILHQAQDVATVLGGGT